MKHGRVFFSRLEHMVKYSAFLLLILSSLVCGTPLTVPQINKLVDSIDAEVKNQTLEKTLCKTETQGEVAPPEIAFYHADGRLKAAIATMEHEGWENRFLYYFDAQGNPLKYLKITTRPDEINKRTGIIYGSNGTILWKSADSVPIQPGKVAEMFRSIWAVSLEYSKY